MPDEPIVPPKTPANSAKPESGDPATPTVDTEADFAQPVNAAPESGKRLWPWATRRVKKPAVDAPRRRKTDTEPS